MASTRTCTLLALVGSASATAYTWRGIIDNQWTTANNWQPVGVPGDNPSDAVTIDDQEGKNANVQLTTKDGSGKNIAVLNVGDKMAAKAKLTVLVPLTVSQSVSVPPNGELQINSGTAALNTPSAAIQGKLEFYSGVLQGTYSIQTPGQACFGSADFQGAKTFNYANVSIDTSAPVLAGGPWMFDQKSSISIKTAAIQASGNAFQIQLKDAQNSTGNSISAVSFSWAQ